jgi:hypothetical protein
MSEIDDNRWDAVDWFDVEDRLELAVTIPSRELLVRFVAVVYILVSVGVSIFR